MDIIDDLQWRGAINQQTDADGLKKEVNEKKFGLYAGIDPTGDSMHVGHLIPFMILKRFQLAGFKPVILIGGATGSIGDPSGKKAERKLQSMEQVKYNEERLTNQMKKLFGEDGKFQIVNNYDWASQFSLLDFLRDYGKRFNVNTMLNKEIVSSRLETGISYTEFTYQILQAMDFEHLYKNNDVELQIGGADQWGNITGGIELIHKTQGADAKAFGLTIPLMLKADGTKFGKTEGGAVWLDPEKTTPYEFYQFWINTDDRDAIKYLKYFTFLDREEIEDLEDKVKSEPWKREAQRRLAEEVTEFVHGKDAVVEAQNITEALFSGNVQDLTTAEVETGFKNMPSVEVSADKKNIVEWLADDTEIEPSRRQAREDVKNGAIRINGEKVDNVDADIDPSQSFDGKFVVVRRGKKKYYLARIK
ncbi:tyrosine--tRNA ligase [Apilactobacillus apinorum]|uniref:tyrosine--tRNA ligase n=1 Tax=Apilactobacillus apinorum TaxID=1218495 RepID=UPI0006B543EE|nr:tyrosine--tRNA ligase [Apilactobacillus apinorum]KOY69757.1 Tyrosine--tRNA ligase [Apilactobacillus apinorum]CAI2628688.1 tyrS Tyrosine--tRNA ligase [Apilactobacillus apinorum]